MAALACGRVGFDSRQDAALADGKPNESAAPSIAFVQHGEKSVNNLMSASVLLAAAQGAGDLNVVAVGFAGTIASIADTSGNSYALATGPLANASTGKQAIYYASPIAPAAAGTNTLTVTFTAPSNCELRVLEYSGIASAGALDVAASSMGNGAVASATLATTAANELLVAADLLQGSSVAPGAPFTMRSTLAGDIVEDHIATSAGMYTASDTQNPAGGWVMQIAAFRAL